MNKGRVWRHPETFQRMAVERFKCCESIEHLAKELGVARQTLYRIIASITRPANSGDNANCQSFFRTLKREEITTEKGPILRSDIVHRQNLRTRQYR